MFSRGTIVLVLFVVIVGAIIGLSQFLQNQPPLEITVAVNPMAEDWMQSVAAEFNDSDVFANGTIPIQVNVITASDVAVWESGVNWTIDDHPEMWIPASSASVSYTPSNVRYSIIVDSTARSPLVWGGFESRVNLLSETGTLDWDVLAEAVQTNDGNWASLGGQSGWGFLKLAYARPANDIAGLAVLFSGAGEFTGSTTLDRQALLQDDFNDWMRAIVGAVPNFQTLGGDPAATMASRGTSVAEIALLPEVLWLNSLDDLGGSDPITFSYPSTQFILDFPLAMWDDNNVSDDTRTAVEAFADYVMGAGQRSVTDFGLRPADGEPDDNDLRFASGTSFGIILEPDYGQVVTAPDRNTADTLLERFG